MDDKLKHWITFLAKTYVAVILSIIGGTIIITALFALAIFLLFNAG